MSVKKPLLIVFAVMVLTESFLFGAAVNLSNTRTESFWPAMAISPNGTLMAVYTDSDSSGGNDIFFSTSTDGGTTWTPPVRTYSKQAYVKACAIDADSSGNFHLIWADGYGSARREIHYRAYMNGTWRDVEQVSYSYANSNWCRISVEGNQVHVVWYQERGGTQKSFAAYKSKTVGGAWPSNPIDVSRNTSNGAMYPDIKAVNNNLYVIYQIHEYRGDTVLGRHVGYSERVNGVWHGPESIGSYTWPAITADEYNNVHCLYPNAGTWVLYNGKINGNWTGENAINSERGEKCFFDIKYRNDCLFAAFMQDSSRGPGYYSIWYAMKTYNNGWGSWGIPIELEMGSYAELPKVALDANGTAHVLWIDHGVGGDFDVFYENVPLLNLNQPYIQIDNSYLSFSGLENETLSPQTFRVKNAGTETLNYSISTDKSWLYAAPQSGNSTGEWDEIAVTVDTYSLAAGGYTGTVTISSGNAPNSPKEVMVQLTLGSEDPTIQTDTDILSFSHSKGSANPSPQQFKIRNFGKGSMSYQISTAMLWITVSPQHGVSNGEWDEINVSVDAQALPTADYSGTITITSNEADNSPQQVSVLLTMSEGGNPTIQLDKAGLIFTDTPDADPPPQTFKIRNGGKGTLSYKVSSNKGWIKPLPLSGSSTGEWDEIKVSVTPNSVGAGTHTGTITISAPGATNSPRTLNVTLIKKQASLQLNATYLSFMGIIWESNPQPQTFSIRNSGVNTLDYTIQCNQDWLKTSPVKGISKGEWDAITISPQTLSLGLGEHEGRITVSAPNADKSPQSIKVVLTVKLPPEPYPPLNVTETRIDNEGLYIKNYITKVTWSKNPKNYDLFNIVKFRIFRREKDSLPNDWVWITDVTSSQELKYQETFGTKLDRDRYLYAVAAADDKGQESNRAQTGSN